MKLPVARVATTYATVLHTHRVPRHGGVERAAEEQLLGDPVDHGDQQQDRGDPLVGVVEHAGDLPVDQRDLPHDQGADDEHAGQQQPERDGAGDRAAQVVVGAGAGYAAEVQRAGRERPDRPDAREHQGGDVERGVARVDLQRPAEADRADHHEHAR